MKLYEFLGLSEVEQYDSIWSFGVHVDSFIRDSKAINLYVINNFYCEVYYDIKTNKILYKKTFKHGELLDKYLDKIKL
jgi:hypothetical protein